MASLICNDQWDWEKHISPKDRNVLYLKETVRDIVGAICDTSAALRNAFPALTFKPDRDVYFITTQELEDRYPDLTPNEREVEICRKHHTVFLMQIGKTLASGKRHDGRAPDYDDWELNGDILMWNPILERSFELSSMGIRVDAAALDRQLTAANCNQRRELPFHKMLLNGQLPQSIGGGIGQSRLCMLLIGTCHIGEVQVSLWDADTTKTWKMLVSRCCKVKLPYRKSPFQITAAAFPPLSPFETENAPTGTPAGVFSHPLSGAARRQWRPPRTPAPGAGPP